VRDVERVCRSQVIESPFNVWPTIQRIKRSVSRKSAVAAVSICFLEFSLRQARSLCYGGELSARRSTLRFSARVLSVVKAK